MKRVAIVAGEASGDRIAAMVARALAARGVSCFGVGGPACRDAGVQIVADASDLGAMGIGDVLVRLPAIGAAVVGLLRRVDALQPRAALLVNFTELNQRLGRALRARGIKVLWCVAPQVWAWRPGRMKELHGAVDRLAVILPFEEALWREGGFDARYVGHPALEAPRQTRREIRERLGIREQARAVAVLPGSRAGEVRRLAEALCGAARRLVDDGMADVARMIAAPGLAEDAARHARTIADHAGLDVIEGDRAHGAAALLGGFDAVLCASGTASLEAALAGAPPVVTYRLGRVSFAIARRLVLSKRIALPNVLLGRGEYPELVQDEVTEPRIAEAGRRVLGWGRRAAEDSARELARVLAVEGSLGFGARVADRMEGWLD